MHVRHEDVIRLRRCGAVARHRLLSEGSHARAQVAQHVLGPAGLDLDAGGVPAVAAGDRQSEIVDVGVQLVIRVECPPGSATQRADQLVADAGRCERDRKGTARTPEPDALHVATAS
jgi:hypothetical protein